MDHAVLVTALYGVEWSGLRSSRFTSGTSG